MCPIVLCIKLFSFVVCLLLYLASYLILHKIYIFCNPISHFFSLWLHYSCFYHSCEGVCQQYSYLHKLIHTFFWNFKMLFCFCFKYFNPLGFIYLFFYFTEWSKIYSLLFVCLLPFETTNRPPFFNIPPSPSNSKYYFINLLDFSILFTSISGVLILSY